MFKRKIILKPSYVLKNLYKWEDGINKIKNNLLILLNMQKHYRTLENVKGLWTARKVNKFINKH